VFVSDESEKLGQPAAVAAIEFALQPDSDGMEFLRVWFHGEFDVIRKEWPEAPEAVFIGADPLHPKTTEPEEKKFWPELESFVEDYIGGYEFRGDEGDYTPNDRERFLIEDCAAGLLHELNQEGWLPQSPTAPQPDKKSFQARVAPWMQECFGPEISADQTERNHRFLEEALELVQACGCSADEAHKLVDYVFARPVGEKSQEVGGVHVTLAALCLAQDIDSQAAAESELARIMQPEMVERIREKQKRKPAMSPLPGIYPDRPESASDPER
jgi:hypothetical protein